MKNPAKRFGISGDEVSGASHCDQPSYSTLCGTRRIEEVNCRELPTHISVALDSNPAAGKQLL
jgi:hypothetical protein